MLDFLQSRTFVTHMTGLAAIFGTAWTVPNSPYASLAIALLTGITQACHAYQAAQEKTTLSAADLSVAMNAPMLMNAAGTVEVAVPEVDTHAAGPVA